MRHRYFARNIPGTSAKYDDLQGVINSAMDFILSGGGLSGDINDDTLRPQVVRVMIGQAVPNRSLQWNGRAPPPECR